MIHNHCLSTFVISINTWQTTKEGGAHGPNYSRNVYDRSAAFFLWQLYAFWWSFCPPLASPLWREEWLAHWRIVEKGINGIWGCENVAPQLYKQSVKTFYPVLSWTPACVFLWKKFEIALSYLAAHFVGHCLQIENDGINIRADVISCILIYT